MIWVLHNPRKSSNFAPDYDNNIDYRTTDSAAGHDARLCLRVLYEGRDVSSIAEVIFTRSTWSLLENGTKFRYHRQI